MADVIVFTVKGKRYPMPENLTFGDAALLRKLGVNLGELARAVSEDDQGILADPVVMGGLLLVSMKHAGVKVTPNTLNDLEISEVDVELPDAPEDEEPDADPLAVAPPTPPPSPSSETTPADSGPLDSDTSIDSILGT